MPKITLNHTVKITKLEEKHLSQMARIANNSKIADQLKDYFPHPYLLKDAFELYQVTKQENPQLTFAITYKKDFCGIISLTPQKDVYRFSAEIGYWVGESYWSKGIATAAIRQICAYGFQTLALQKIYARVFASNLASMRILEKSGFELEGIQKRAAYKKNQWVDLHLYGLTHSQ